LRDFLEEIQQTQTLDIDDLGHVKNGIRCRRRWYSSRAAVVTALRLLRLKAG
jgi:hypothetical protein